MMKGEKIKMIKTKIKIHGAVCSDRTCTKSAYLFKYGFYRVDAGRDQLLMTHNVVSRDAT